MQQYLVLLSILNSRVNGFGRRVARNLARHEETASNPIPINKNYSPGKIKKWLRIDTQKAQQYSCERR